MLSVFSIVLCGRLCSEEFVRCPGHGVKLTDNIRLSSNGRSRRVNFSSSTIIWIPQVDGNINVYIIIKRSFGWIYTLSTC